MTVKRMIQDIIKHKNNGHSNPTQLINKTHVSLSGKKQKERKGPSDNSSYNLQVKKSEVKHGKTQVKRLGYVINE